MIFSATPETYEQRIYTLSYITGLRKGELASLTPKSFKLTGKQPTVTIDAKPSKHRKKDVLPLHPELVPMIKRWIKGIGAEQPIFEKLDKRKTWLMVKKDLERVGIVYQTHEGIADFHASEAVTHTLRSCLETARRYQRPTSWLIIPMCG